MTSFTCKKEEGSLLKDTTEHQKPPHPQSEALERLRKMQIEHPFWNNRLFRACKGGHLIREDFQFIFSQYYLYSKNFTRYLAALMAKSNSDFHRARLSENLWEEGGGMEPDKRHAELFRRFLKDGLSINIGEIEFLDSTRYFVREYLDFCLDSHPMNGSSFLSLGTEGIVARMYEIFVEGMLKANIDDDLLQFFHIHMECDDEHAATLEDMMLSYSNEPDWYNSCLRSMDWALTLRNGFFENLYDGLLQKRLQDVVKKIQSHRSLAEFQSTSDLYWNDEKSSIPMYSNVNSRLNIEFDVQRLPFRTETLDPRLLKIPPGKNNEKHRHAHETVFHVMQGTGKVFVDDKPIEVKAGDVIFVPRWCMHQSHNTGDTEMVVLAITDFGLTSKAYLGDHEALRMKHREETAVGL